MNANELADALDDVVANYIQMIADVDFSDVATMLRQQQAEIEALKVGKIRAYNNGVEDGRKPDTNNKPVAWMSKKGILSYVNDMGFTIPLYTHSVNPYQSITNTKIEPTVVSYTHPVKELTDEEMKNLIQEYWGDVHIVDPDGYLHEIAFIRAILRKAQEKC